tara:strand:+ start:1632 stop:1850 length:219 start_codon:yes stop_codon:yes gene_type:complete
LEITWGILILHRNKGVCMTITSKDLSKGGGLTGVARKEAEKAQINQKLLEKAIEQVQKNLKKKKEPKKKKST